MNTSRLDQYFAEYSKSHENPINKRIHIIAVPLIFFSVLGLLMSIPTPGWFFETTDWSTPFTVGALIFYFSFRSARLNLVITGFIAIQLLLLQFLRPNLLVPCSIIFVLAWIAQFYGHHLEGRKPAFFRDLFFLLIGPLWVLRSLKLLK